MYYFKPYNQTLSSYAVQLLSWGMGEAMAKYLPNKKITIFGKSFSLNPGPWNAKEHALIIVAYWGSCYAAYGMSFLVCTGHVERCWVFGGGRLDQTFWESLY